MKEQVESGMKTWTASAELWGIRKSYRITKKKIL